MRIMFLPTVKGAQRGEVRRCLGAGAALTKYLALKRRKFIRAEGFETTVTWGQVYVVHYD